MHHLLDTGGQYAVKIYHSAVSWTLPRRDAEMRMTTPLANSETVVTAKLQRATRLRQSIIQKVFHGELVFADQLSTGKAVP